MSPIKELQRAGKTDKYPPIHYIKKLDNFGYETKDKTNENEAEAERKTIYVN